MRWRIAWILAFICGADAVYGAGERYALLIGVKDYENQNIRDLNAPERDVEYLKEKLLEVGGFRPDRVRTMTGSSRPEFRPTKTNIQSQIQDWLGQTGPEDVAIVYFSGHGSIVRGETPGEKDKCLLPMDVRPGKYATYIRDNELRDWLSRVRARKVLVVDACYTGGEGSKSYGEGKDLDIPSFTEEDDLAAAADVVLTASEAKEPAGEDRSSRYSTFTYHLGRAIEAFSDTDRSGDGRLDPYELHEAVMERVVRATEGRQHPTILPEVPPTGTPRPWSSTGGFWERPR